MCGKSPLTIVTLLLVLTCFSSLALAADEEKKTGWSDAAEFALVLTSGNSDTTTFGFKNTLKRSWEKAEFTLKAGGIRAESDTSSFAATGTPANFVVTETKTNEITAANYYLNGRYDREIHERFFWFAGAGWDRNTLAGIKGRSTAFGGVGNVWIDTDTTKFKTDYAATWTDENAKVPNPALDDSYFGLRFSWTYLHEFNDSTEYGNDFVVLGNLSELDDFRADMINWVSVAMTKRLALKVSLQTLYDNEPALVSIPLNATTTMVNIPVDDLDNLFTASLVVNF